MLFLTSIVLALTGARSAFTLPTELGDHGLSQMAKRDQVVTTSGTGTYGGYVSSPYSIVNCSETTSPEVLFVSPTIC
jgi:hypothetical protein